MRSALAGIGGPPVIRTTTPTGQTYYSRAPVTLPGGLGLPMLPISESKETARWFKDLHETGATVGYVLVGLHAAAALVHHYVQRDNTVLRMLPGTR